MPNFSGKDNLISAIQARYHEIDYTYERFINGSCEILTYPIAGVINRFEVIPCEGPAMRYRFDYLGREI